MLSWALDASKRATINRSDPLKSAANKRADVRGSGTSVFVDGHAIAPDLRADLASRNMPVIDGRITGIARQGNHAATISTDAGSDVAVDILFAHPRTTPSASLHEALGLATINTPTGIALEVDAHSALREVGKPLAQLGVGLEGCVQGLQESPRLHRRRCHRQLGSHDALGLAHDRITHKGRKRHATQTAGIRQ